MQWLLNAVSPFAPFCLYATVATVKYLTSDKQEPILYSMLLSINEAAAAAPKFARHGRRQRG